MRVPGDERLTARSGRGGPAPVTVSAWEAHLGRRSYVPWQCGDCEAVLPFPKEAEVACPRCGQGAEASARLASRLESAAGAASDPATRAWLLHTASAWRGLPGRTPAG